MSFKREFWKKHKEKQGEFLKAVERLIKIGGLILIITADIHMITKFSLSLNTYHTEYGERWLDSSELGCCSAGWMEEQWGDNV